MHVAVITSYFPVLSQTFVLNQITSLLDAGHEVTIIANRPQEAEPVHGAVDHYDLLTRTLYWDKPVDLRADIAAVLGILKRAALSPGTLSLANGESLRTRHRRAVNLYATPIFDAVVCHFGNLGRECQLLREIGALKGPLATIFHGYDMSRLLLQHGDAFYEDLLARGELFLPISDFWRRRLITLGADPERTRVHHMGIDPERFAFRPRHQNQQRGARILSIGRFVEKKGFAAGIKAFATVATDFPEARYTIVGDGALMRELQELVDELGVSDRVYFPGYQSRDEVQRAIDDHDILLVPSQTAADGDMEGIPVVLMEAMASGMPVISTRHSGIPELVAHGESGLLAGEADVEGLAEHLRTLLSDPARWESMGRAGRQIVEAQFSLHELNARLIAQLESIASRASTD